MFEDEKSEDEGLNHRERCDGSKIHTRRHIPLSVIVAGMKEVLQLWPIRASAISFLATGIMTRHILLELFSRRLATDESKLVDTTSFTLPCT
jgi:hypothetical protein